jgi:hypothetical protein
LVVALRIAGGLEIDLPGMMTRVMQRHAKELRGMRKVSK